MHNITEILNLHAKWLHGESGGVRANLRYTDLRSANLSYANLSSADLRSANLQESFGGICFADCCWTAHGEQGRRLLAVILPAVVATETEPAREREITYFCGCFRGTEAELREYIANDGEQYRKSRIAAVDFVSARIAEMIAMPE